MSLPRPKLITTPVILLSLLLFIIPKGFCQDPFWSAATSPAATYFQGSAIDYVDMSNGSLHVHIPLLADTSQRGDLNFAYSLNLSGPVEWTLGEYGGYSFWNYSGQAPLAQVPDGWPIGVDAAEGQSNAGGPYYWAGSIVNWVVDSDGGNHYLGTTNGSGTLMETVDGSGIQYRTDSSHNYTLTNRRGIQFYFPTCLPSCPYPYLSFGSPSTVTDANGNQMTINSSGVMTDTLGRSWFNRGSTNTTQCPTSANSAETMSVPGPNGGTRQFIFCYSNLTVGTNFQCPNLYDLSEPWGLLTGVVLPDLTTWRFDYDSRGALIKVYLPTGGTISYTLVYGGPTGNPIPCGGVYLQSRTVNDGTNSNTWTFSPPKNFGTDPWTTTDPLGNDKAYYPDTSVYCQSPYGNGGPPYPGIPYLRTQTVKYYSGSASSGTLLKTETHGYKNLDDPYPIDLIACLDAGLPSSITTTLANQNQKTVKSQKAYDTALSYQDPVGAWHYSSLGLLDSDTQYDYGNGVPGGPLSQSSTQHIAENNYIDGYLGYNLLDLVQSQSTYDGNGNLCASTSYGYDESAPDSSGLGPSQHLVPVSGLRGNLTSITMSLFSSPCTSPTPSVTSLKISNHFYDTGKLHTSTDPLGNPPPTYSYAGTYQGAYPTSVCNALSQCTTLAYDLNTGLVTSMTDPNNQSTSFTWDNMLRPLVTAYPDGGQTSIAYNISGRVFLGDTVTKKITSSQNLMTTQVFDGLGRLKETQLTSDPEGTDYADISYDADGRKSKVYNQTRCNPPQTNCGEPTWGYTTYNYDPLNRVTSVVEQDGSTVTTNYSAFPCTTVTDEAGKTRESCVDGAGRMTSVLEDPGSSPHLNYPTSYTYDALSDLLSVTQSSSRQRGFSYDSLSRLTSATNPESGTATYQYDSDSNMTHKTSPAPNQSGASTVTLTYCYDALNRMTAKGYTQQTCSSNGNLPSPVATYLYDQSSNNGLTITNGIGRRTGMTDQAGIEAWSYDKMGRVAADQRTTNGITKTTTYSTISIPYNLDGTIAQLAYPSGRALTYTTDSAERPSLAKDVPNSLNYAIGLCASGGGSNGACYTPSGLIASVQNGGSLYSTYLYNPRLQPCWLYTNTSATGAPTSCTQTGVGTAAILDYQYNFSLGSGDNGNVNAITNRRDNTRSQNFTYDPVNRLGSAQTQTIGVTIPNSNCWGLTFGYDAWADLLTSSTTGPAGCSEPTPLNVSVNPATNQIATNTVAGQVVNFCYDAAGNLLETVVAPATCPTSGPYQNAYDAENHLTTTGTVTYTYDGDGKRVEKSNGKLYWYGTSSDPLDETDLSGNTGNSSFYEYIFFGGKRVARRDYQNNVDYYFADHLGTSRVVTNAGGTLLDDSDFYPFGGERPILSSSGNTYKFTGKERDSESGLDNFGARYNSSQYGRFMSPDPVGGKPAFPQTWNAYAYVGNNPLKYIDPTGLDCVYLNDQGNGIESIDNQSSAGECQQTGGAWAPGTITDFQYDPFSNDVLLGYAYGDTSNIQYSQITAAPGQFNPGDELFGVAAGINADNPQGFINAVGTLMPLGGVAAYGGIAVAGTYGWGTITTAGVTTAGTLGPAVQDPKLQTFVNMLFQATDKLPGGTAGAVRSEIRTGELLSDAGHSIKAQEIVNGLQNLVKSGTLSQSDTATAKGLVEDLKGALATSPWIR